LQMMSRNKLATLKAVKLVGRAPKCAPLENLSTTTRMTVKSWEWGRPVMKSRERSSQIAIGIGRG
jgi:hypothetical protein